MSMKAGAWKANITPPLGCCIAGSFSVIHSTGILDDISVHALVLDDGLTKTAILSCDIIGVPEDMAFGRIIPQITERTGIPKDHIIIGATHIHSGPVLSSPLPEVFGWPDETYNEWFCQQAVSAAEMACQRTVEVTVNAGRAYNDRCVFDRRLKKPGGGIVMNWVDRDYIKDFDYSPNRDTELIAVRMDDLAGKPVAMLVNYGNHNNAMSGELINPDMAGHMRKVLSGVYGHDMVTLFLMGPSGNVNWIDHKNPDWHARDTWIRFGESMAGTVLQALTVPERIADTRLGVTHEVLKLTDRPYCAYDTFEDDTFGPPEKAKDFFTGYRADTEKYGNQPQRHYDIDVHALAIGSAVAITTNPFEYFIEFGKWIKAESPFTYTMVSQLTNGTGGYVPTEEAYEEGGYEVRKIMMGSYMEKQAGTKVADSAIRQLKKLAGG